MGKRPILRQVNVIDLLNERERAFLSPETINLIRVYSSYISDSKHRLIREKHISEDYTINTGFFCLGGLAYDDYLREAFFLFMSKRK
jgi:hypothetical protein